MSVGAAVGSGARIEACMWPGLPRSRTYGAAECTLRRDGCRRQQRKGQQGRQAACREFGTRGERRQAADGGGWRRARQAAQERPIARLRALRGPTHLSAGRWAARRAGEPQPAPPRSPRTRPPPGRSGMEGAWRRHELQSMTRSLGAPSIDWVGRAAQQAPPGILWRCPGALAGASIAPAGAQALSCAAASSQGTLPQKKMDAEGRAPLLPRAPSARLANAHLIGSTSTLGKQALDEEDWPQDEQLPSRRRPSACRRAGGAGVCAA